MGVFNPKRRIMSFVYAAQGFKWAFATQGNLWIHLLAALAAISSGFYFHVTTIEWCLIVTAIVSVFAAEFFNTAIEWLVDSIYKEQHPIAGKIKDVSAAAVLAISIGALITGLILFIPYVFK